ncbi:MAG TPA: LytR C-terminal domain-containing protein, partial [Acidimicrobiia bacterium]|nr:LytR C-terminal domain-containing protein [Acidimicrobiia bacterium]
PEEVRVVVLNSMGLPGAAGRMTQRLADAGYQTQQADDFEPEQDPSRIWYREGFAAEANALLEFVPGAVIESIPDPVLEEGSDLVLVLGTGFTE